LALVVACFPLIAFFIAAVAELRAGGRVSTVVLRMIPLCTPYKEVEGLETSSGNDPYRIAERESFQRERRIERHLVVESRDNVAQHPHCWRGALLG
jgi:hypothetical protein